MSEIGFDELNLSETMMAAIEHVGYEQPSPVQAGVIPPALTGVDVVGQAQTGTGKTASFVIPILERMKSTKDCKGVQAIILVPTRELAVQVHGEIEKLAHGRRVRSVALYGGKPIRGQIEKLRKGAQIAVGTPGRVLDHMSRSTLDLSSIHLVVLDEADRMLDIGFRPDIEKILRRCPQSRQTLLLSATVPPPIERLAQRYMRDPINLNFSPKEITIDTIEQHYFTVDARRKFDLLVRLLKRDKPRQAIVFCRTRRGTDKIYQRLSKRLSNAGAIHGDMAQSARDRVMNDFRSGKITILVATDVIGRGIDITTISHIINYDIPQFCDDYVHRVGRAGRMGREGIAYTFVTSEEGNELTQIEMRINTLLKRDEMEDFDPTAAEDRPGAPTNSNAAPPSTPPPPPPPGGRRIKRYRRGL